MKKENKIRFAVLALFLLIYSIPLVLSLDITIKKDSYYPYETLQAEIPDIFTNTLTLENIGIYKENSVHKSPSESGILKSEGKYLFYAILPESEGNYFVKIENMKYYENMKQKEDIITKNFSIKNTNSSYLSFNPGYIYATDDFSVIIRSFNEKQDIKVDFPATGFKKSFSLGYGESKQVLFTISGIKNITKSSIKINSYELPVTIYPKLSSPNKTLVENDSLKELLAVDTKEINATILYNSDFYFQITIINREHPVYDLNISSPDEEISIFPSEIEKVEGEKIINITINSKENLTSKIIFSIENSSIIIPVNIILTKNQSNISSNIPIVNQERTCSRLGGIKCSSVNGESCTGTTTYAYDGICCMAECKVKSSSSKTWIFGIILLILLVIGGYFLYKKSKQGSSSEKEIFNKRIQNYKEKSSPIEVRKSLSR